MNKMRAVSGTSLFVVSVFGAWAQATEPAPAFEVASVKLNPANLGVRKDAITVAPASVTMLGLPLKAIIQWAYHQQPMQVVGPGWIESDRFDIVAKSAGPESNERLRLMMQTLLTQRFQLEFHKETKVMPAYVVSIAKGGHKLKQSEGEGEMDVLPNGSGKMVVSFTHVTLAQLSEMAFSPLPGIVVDETGLKGSWDFTIDGSAIATSQPTGIEDMLNMLIDLVYRQLGLKIEQKKVPADLMVIDRAERVPTGN